MRARDFQLGISLRDARTEWLKLGGRVRDVRATGEERYSHLFMERTIRVKKRRKDAPRKLVVALRRIADWPRAA